jgi:predicted thioredoxin/glutaredoxin
MLGQVTTEIAADAAVDATCSAAPDSSVKLARALSNDNGDERLIACAVAVKWMASHARRDQRDGDLERALELLQEAGYSEFSLGQLAAVRQSATFRELRDLWGRRPKDLRQAERVEFVERFRNLLIAAGAAACG